MSLNSSPGEQLKQIFVTIRCLSSIYFWNWKFVLHFGRAYFINLTVNAVSHCILLKPHIIYKPREHREIQRTWENHYHSPFFLVFQYITNKLVTLSLWRTFRFSCCFSDFELFIKESLLINSLNASLNDQN